MFSSLLILNSDNHIDTNANPKDTKIEIIHSIEKHDIIYILLKNIQHENITRQYDKPFILIHAIISQFNVNVFSIAERDIKVSNLIKTPQHNKIIFTTKLNVRF